MDGCAHCGGAATLVLRENGSSTPICGNCLDRFAPELRLGSLRAQFMRDRKVAGICPYCGCTNDQLIKTGLAGCPLCYEALDVAALIGQ